MKPRLIVVGIALLTAACDNGTELRVVGELASDRIELTAEAAEPVVEILVAEGERVTAGQLLLRQDSSRARSRLAEADAALAQAQARLDELVRGPRRESIAAARAAVAGANDDVDFRRAELARVQQVYDRKLVAPDVLDRARAELDSAVASLDVQQARLEELLTGTTVEELAQAEAVVRQAAARRDLLAVDLDRLEIRAPADGIVDSRLFEPGERPAPGQAVLIVLSGDQPYARVYVPEQIRVGVLPGLTARIRIDGLDEPVPGRVRWVASEAAFTPYFALTERDRGHLAYLAKIDIAEDRDRLPDGLPVEVEFVAGAPQ